MNTKKQSILVTGGGGNLGASFIKKFATVYDVHAVVRSHQAANFCERHGAKPYILSQRDPKSVRRIVAAVQPDVIVANAACVNLVDSDEVIDELVDANISLTLDYLQAASRLHRCHFISFDSYSSYDELGKPLYGSAYGRSKFIARELCELYSLRENMRSTNLVLYDIYHAGDERPNKIFNRVINAIKNDIPTPLSLCDQEISFVHMSDVLRAIELIIEMPKNSSFESYSVRGPEVKALKQYFDPIFEHERYKNLLFGDYEDQRPVQKLIDKYSCMPPGYEPQMAFSCWLINRIKDVRNNVGRCNGGSD